MKQLKSLIEQNKTEEILQLLSKNKINCRDVYNCIEEIKKEIFDLFYNSKIDIKVLDANMKILNTIKKEVEENFHDFIDKSKIFTLDKKEWIYYK